MNNSLNGLFDTVRTLTGTTTLGPSGPESYGNERVLHIAQIFITQASPSDAV